MTDASDHTSRNERSVRAIEDLGALTLPARTAVLRAAAVLLLLPVIALTWTIPIGVSPTPTLAQYEFETTLGAGGWFRVTSYEPPRFPFRPPNLAPVPTSRFEILPLGIVVNVVLTGAIVWIAFRLGKAVARRWRPLADRCDICGHPHQQPAPPHEQCTECGAVILHQRRYRHSALCGSPFVFFALALIPAAYSTACLETIANALEHHAELGTLEPWVPTEGALESATGIVVTALFIGIALMVLTVVAVYFRYRNKNELGTGR